MTQFKLPLLAGLAAAAALSLGSPALAVSTAKPAAKGVVKPAVKAHPAALHAKPAATGRMVTARLGNGKTVTYNCNLPGNQTKQACKR